MTSKFELIERYILRGLSESEESSFLEQLNNSEKLQNELNLHEEIFDAIQEENVMKLRNTLNNMMDNKEDNKENKDLFDLARNLKKLSEQENQFDPEKKKNSLKEIHVENHKKAQTEKVHFFENSASKPHYGYTSKTADELLWSEIEVAISEKEVMQLRENLINISKKPDINYTEAEIDQFINNELEHEIMTHIEDQAKYDRELQNQIKLHNEIEEAISENEIMSLRDNISDIIMEEKVSRQKDYSKIDDYLLNDMNEKEKREFEEKFNQEKILVNELNLQNDINKAIKEDDIMSLRNNLNEIMKNSNTTEDDKIRKLVHREPHKKPVKWLGAAASIAAVISIGSLTLLNQRNHSEAIYKDAFKHYEAGGLYRSVAETDPFFKGLDYYNAKEYDLALQQFDVVLLENPEHPMSNFYAGLILQERTDYKRAISHYQQVIKEKDNLFIEQAEWYMSLCILKTNDRKKAFKHFNDIANREKSYYKDQAKKILRKLK